MKHYIHLGASKEKVSELLGEPSKINNNLWTYGSSHIKFNGNGEVIAWKNMFGDLSRAFRTYSPTTHKFFFGSTVDDVLEALGSPTGVDESFEPVWHYESSHVKFDGAGNVIEWKSVYNQLSNGLQKPVEGSEYFKVGSTQGDVLNVMGAPDAVLAINPDVWCYGSSHIKFRDNKVVEWRNQYRQLDMGMKLSEEGAASVHIGSSEEEVLLALGSPTEVLVINPNVWHYKESHLLFEDHHVIEWRNVYKQLDGGLKSANYNDYIRVGLTKEEVSEIFGSPDRVLKINPDVWYYDTSHIKFLDNKVCEWRNMFRDLEKGFKKGSASNTDVKLGSNRELVLNRLGSPSCLLEKEPYVWHYGNASVIFDLDMTVTSWKNIDDIKTV